MEGILILLQKQMIWVLNDINICEEWVKQGTNFTKSVSLLTILHIAVVFTHSARSSHGPRNYFYILHIRYFVWRVVRERYPPSMFMYC